MLTTIDQFVQELIAKKNAEDVSSYAHFFTGFIIEDEKLDEQELKQSEDVTTGTAIHIDDKPNEIEPTVNPEEVQDESPTYINNVYITSNDRNLGHDEDESDEYRQLCNGAGQGKPDCIQRQCNDTG